jgi:hypothetical protein
VKTAKANLNRYWHKFEELLNVENTIKQKNLRMNNKISPMMDEKHIQDLNNASTQKFLTEKNVSHGKYKHFMDDSLYYGVNLKPAVVLTSSPVNRHSYCCDHSCLPAYPFISRKITFEEEENFHNEFNEFIFEGSLV